MQPEFFDARDLRYLGNRIEGRRRRAAAGRDDGTGLAPGGAISRDRSRQRMGVHVEIPVDRNHAHVLAPESREQRGLFHRAVRLR